MKTVAKLIIRHDEDFLMMHRSDHPSFGIDPDLPGGTSEENESSLQAMMREVEEEIGFKVNPDQVHEIFSGSGYSKNGTHYSLYIINVSNKPKIAMSWEHSSFEWTNQSEFIEKALAAKDTYMHMVGNILKSYKLQ
jgi:8-oxo-dGTP pyrophosphatase MutT (NUDIX family)